MCHPKRAGFVGDLQDALDAPSTVIWDERDDRWHTGRRAMLAYDPAATHHLVVQDDALVCRDLVAGLTQAVRFVPERAPVCLYVGRVRPMRDRVRQAALEADRAKANWLVMRDLNWGVAVCVPTDVIDEMITEVDRQSIPNYDSRMSGYFARRGIPVYYTWPSLVDHRDAPSLVHGRGSGRVAHRFIGRETSALDVNWSGVTVDIRRLGEARMTTFRSRRTGRSISFPANSRTAQRYRAKTHWIEEDGCPSNALS
jgi:hypothetical protein